jgi:hypothetical protein
LSARKKKNPQTKVASGARSLRRLGRIAVMWCVGEIGG